MQFFACFSFYLFSFLFLSSTLKSRSGKDLRNNRSIKSALIDRAFAWIAPVLWNSFALHDANIFKMQLKTYLFKRHISWLLFTVYRTSDIQGHTYSTFLVYSVFVQAKLDISTV